MARSESSLGGRSSGNKAKQASSGANSLASSPPVSEGARILQERLHILLSRLANTIDHVKNWPEAKGDDASIHVESTSKLIDSIRQVISSLERVEGVVKTDATVRASLSNCLIPLDLLDLLDSSNLNPDCFSRGLLREALGQLAGLKRRKLALELLGAAVQSGLQKQQQQERLLAEAQQQLEEKAATVDSKKRSQPDRDDNLNDEDTAHDDVLSPPNKKRNTHNTE